jgi:MoaA/NifB/PqqE/SkfB family radical SAM enzyme
MKTLPAPSLRRYFTPEEVAAAVAQDRILTLSLKLPVGCNLRCRYCYGSTETGDLPFQDIVGIVGQASALGARSVSIVGEGEPFLYQDGSRGLLDLVAALNGLGLPVTLFTNNTRVDRDRARRLFALRTSVVAKLNSLDPAVQRKLAGDLDPRAIYSGLEVLQEEGFTRCDPSRLALHTVIVRDNLAEIPELWRWCRRRNIIPYHQVFVPPPASGARGNAASELSVPGPALRDLFRALSELDRREFGFSWDPDASYPIAGLGCGVVRSGCAVDGYGRVKICAYVEEVLGDLRRETLAEVLRKERVRRLRRASYGSARGGGGAYGCRALTFNLTGDRFAADPVFWGGDNVQ